MLWPHSEVKSRSQQQQSNGIICAVVGAGFGRWVLACDRMRHGCMFVFVGRLGLSWKFEV